jgi:HSP20 family protein
MDREKFPYRKIRDRDIFDDFFGDNGSEDRIGRHFDVFDEFEEQFKRMQQRMNNLYRGTLKGDFGISQEGGPKVYGWTYKMGSDGKPVFQEFGNLPKTPLSKPEELPESREPLIDVQETDKQITVIAEIPGVSKEDVDLEVTNDNLIIRVDNPERRYYKEVNLPDEVDQDCGDAKFNNGVLSITLNKLKPKKKGKKLKVD